MLLASIDLGTNTCLLLIAKRSLGDIETVEDYSTVVRLGQGVDQAKRLHPDAKKRTLDCLEKYAATVKKHGIDPSQVVAVGTAQARDAEDGADFFLEVKKKTGFKFRTLTGDEEAKFTFLGGLLPGMNPKELAVIDIGGGSTEFMSHIGGQSLQLGSVRFTERYLKSDPVTDEEFWACEEAVNVELQKMISWREKLDPKTTLIAVAGTATTLASWYLCLNEFDAAKIDQAVLTCGDLHRMVEDLKWRTIDERKAQTGIDAKRADVLLAGAIILWRALEILKFKEIRVSTRGLRYGVLMSI